MTRNKKKLAPKEPIMNEAERVALIVDRYVRNERDREELKKTLTPAIVQFLLRWDSDKEMVMEERIIEIVMKKMHDIYLADNECICKNVAESVGLQLAEVLAPWNERLGNIEGILEGVAKWQTSVDQLISTIDGRVNTLECKEKTEDERIKKLEHLASWRVRIVRKIVVIVIAVGLATLITVALLNGNLAKIEKMLEEHVKIETVK